MLLKALVIIEGEQLGLVLMHHLLLEIVYLLLHLPIVRAGH
jgi:hypothetical protein